MSGEHPAAERLAAYARGGLPREEARTLEGHLAGCADCQARIDRMPSRGTVRWQAHRFARERAAAGAPRDDAEAAGGPLLGALGGIVGALGGSALDELLAASEHERRLLIRDREDFRTLNLAELLEARCRQAWSHDPEAGVELAKLAVVVAGDLDERVYGSATIDRARETAWLHMGNAFRVAGEGFAARAVGEVRDPGAAEPGALGEEVEAALRDVVDTLADRDAAFDATAAALDLAAVLAAADRAGEVEEIAGELVRRLDGPGRAREQAVSLLAALATAAGENALDAAALAALAVRLERLRNDPRARFPPG